MSTEEDGYDVIVVGGGFSGVTAARDLGQRGRSVVLLEARDRLGGRTWYRPFAGTTRRVEFGGTWLATRWQPNVAREIARYNLAIVESPEPESAAWLVGGRRHEGALPVPFDELVDLERGLFSIMQASHRLDSGAPLATPPADLDIPFSDFLESLALPPATHDLIAAYSVGMFGCRPDAVSTLSVLSWVAAYDHSAIAVYLGESEMFAAGTGGAIEAMLADSRTDVRLGLPVQRVSQGNGAVTATARTGESFTARAAIVALPLNVWKDVEFAPALGEVKRTAAAEAHVGHATKVWALARGVPRYFLGVGQGSGLVWIGTQDELPDGSLMVGFGWGPNVLDVHDRDAVQRAIRDFAPGAEVLAIDAHDWSADPYSKGTWLAFRPGQLTRFGSALREPEGRVIFAGSDIATKWAGWIEGAIASGARAAELADGLL